MTGWLWFLGTLVPVIGLIQVGEQAMADRYAYIPMIGIFLMAVWSAALRSLAEQASQFPVKCEDLRSRPDYSLHSPASRFDTGRAHTISGCIP